MLFNSIIRGNVTLCKLIRNQSVTERGKKKDYILNLKKKILKLSRNLYKVSKTPSFQLLARSLEKILLYNRMLLYRGILEKGKWKNQPSTLHYNFRNMQLYNFFLGGDQSWEVGHTDINHHSWRETWRYKQTDTSYYFLYKDSRIYICVNNYLVYTLKF